MDEYTTDAFANRDEPIPLFIVTASDDGSASEAERASKRDRLKQSASRIKAIAQDLGAEQAQRLQNSSTSLQDRLFAKYVQAISHTCCTELTRKTDSCSKSSLLKTSPVVQRPPSIIALLNTSRDHLSASL
jgi:hypothetical protein